MSSATDVSNIELYTFLGLNLYASIDEVKKAYKKMAAKLHPDKNPDNQNATLNFQILQKVYETLSDVNRKYIYDLQISGADYMEGWKEELERERMNQEKEEFWRKEDEIKERTRRMEEEMKERTDEDERRMYERFHLLKLQTDEIRCKYGQELYFKNKCYEYDLLKHIQRINEPSINQFKQIQCIQIQPYPSVKRLCQGTHNKKSHCNNDEYECDLLKPIIKIDAIIVNQIQKRHHSSEDGLCEGTPCKKRHLDSNVYKCDNNNLLKQINQFDINHGNEIYQTQKRRHPSEGLHGGTPCKKRHFDNVYDLLKQINQFDINNEFDRVNQTQKRHHSSEGGLHEGTPAKYSATNIFNNVRNKN